MKTYFISSFCFAHAVAVYSGKAMAAEQPLSSYTTNPNSDSIPMVPAPLELVGSWKGTDCTINEPDPVTVNMEMAPNGANVWSFLDEDTGIFVPMTGDDGIEVIVGYQCVDVGVGYWWGQVPYSDVLWCNLFQVEEVQSTADNSNETTTVSYKNLAVGGQGVGGMSEGACPTSLTNLDETSMQLLQASFTRRMDVASKLSMTCNVPAGSKDGAQPSLNSQFPADQEIPNPFAVADPPSVRGQAPLVDHQKPTRLPVLDEKTCRAKSSEATPTTTAASSTDEVLDDGETPESAAASQPFGFGKFVLFLVEAAVVISLPLV